MPEHLHPTIAESSLMCFDDFTHRTLLAAIWGDNFTEQPEYLRVFLGNLRK